MLSFISLIYQNYLQFPETAVISDSKGEYTNAQLWNVSSCVYSYLSERGIGREDIVLIHLPRGAESVMAMLGVFRAGAAVVALETEGKEEWQTNVQKITPRIVIDNPVMEEIRSTPPLDGFRSHDLHDLAYIAFTTGSSGLQKAVVHEYGTIETAVESYFATSAQYDLSSDRTAYLTSIHTCITGMLMSLSMNSFFDIVPYKEFLDRTSFIRRLNEKRITYLFLSPTYIRKYGFPYTPYIKYVSLSFEPMSGLYYDKYILFNDYGSRETGVSICEFIVDKKYDVTPIGKPLPGYAMSIRDENGLVLPDGMLGEICVDNEYCRGYLDMPEETALHFKNGYYRSGDVGLKMPDGNFVMYGRDYDCIRTGKGLILSLRIEAESRKILNVSNLFVKIFLEGDSPVICLYSDTDIDFPYLQDQLRLVLPEYSIPTDYVRVDCFENKNGKTVKAHLQNPRQ